MHILEKIKEIIDFKNIKNVMIFTDMDGVLVDFDFDVENIRNNVNGTFLNKRPVKTTINNLKAISEALNAELYVLSSCLYNEQALEKSRWLKINAPFIKIENEIYTIAETKEQRKQLKVDHIKEKMMKNNDSLAILIDDTHEILIMARQQLGDNFIPFHVSSLID